jgi:hypothetical protein
MMEPRPSLDRRRLLQGAAAIGVGSLLPEAARAGAAAGLVAAENARPGTRDWLLTKTQVDPATKYRSPWIEGFASHTSIAAGESLTLFVSTRPASPVRIDVYRLGYYGGAGGRLVQALGSFPGIEQPDPPEGRDRLRECQWEPTTSFVIPHDWPSGVYLAKLTAERDGLQSYAIFIVKDERPADFVFQCSDNTWNAYNRWPSQFSLYDDGQKQWYWGPDVAVSFARPYGRYCQILDQPLSQGSGEFLLWEFPLAFWMEQQGYDVTYVSNVDTHRDFDAIRRGRVFLSVGHDEYWSIEMFNHVRRLVDLGVNVAFLSANTCCGVIEYRPDARGTACRGLTRVGQYGPIQQQSVAGFPEMARLRKNGPNEATLIGARSTYPGTGGGDWICRDEKHWLFADTGMKTGDGIPGLVGWEWHGDPADIPGLEIVASGPTTSPRAAGRYTATLYPGPHGNLVFNAATIWWGDGLSEPPGYLRPKRYTEPQGPDRRVQQITHNLFREMLRRRP